ncbi:ABC transporter ATP-binding protein [Pseudotabrizicola alkalilacus]|uniref:sn-glycerol-3-phosphate ABC transporter ATP-binding protein UgpC n=1 Tax=Pseudotabrizicola alkalilacus TaxID=2305252 RepID=A0A411YWZ2_9RHOB|nr:sn-glycerol-3-phosphate ABC transporter ATP-binding protein UgpC [Pseudotabrizicola alkalilacus]RGP35253.1 sn-glycerol-3-phosphate ABC transporter ATP-binding protein UgpC [Pseudotabrizicola alkalilacus]
MAKLVLSDIRKSYGTFEVLKGIDLQIDSGELVVFVGPSGCGKSTLLRMIAGLEEITSGTLELDGVVVNKVSASKRGIAMVFQSYALYPHMTVRKNMAFGLKMARLPKDEIARRVDKAAQMLQLGPYLDRLPKELSGGQRQRVAIGRAITREPRIFLFDEPLSNLDAALRVATRVEIAGLHERLPQATMVYVTHDQVEAMTLADRIVVMNAGRVEQVGTPMDLYHRPANLFVAQFVGSPAMNIVRGRIVDGKPVSDPDGPLHLGMRPEHLVLADAQHPAVIEGRVLLVEHLGEVTLVHVKTAAEKAVIAKLAGDCPVTRGSDIKLGIAAEDVHCFDAEGQRLG